MKRSTLRHDALFGIEQPLAFWRSALPAVLGPCHRAGGTGGSGGGDPADDPADDPKDDPADDPKDDPADDPADDPKDVDHKAEAEKWRALARKHEERAKKNAKAQADLDALKRKGMSDTDAAIQAARDEERAKARVEFGGRLVEAEVRGRAAGKMTDDQVTTLLDGLDRARFLDSDGDVDTEALHAWVDKIAPARRTEQNGNGSTGTDMGQGRGRTKGVTGAAAGAARYAERKAAATGAAGHDSK
jgi:hypothetical protein